MPGRLNGILTVATLLAGALAPAAGWSVPTGTLGQREPPLDDDGLIVVDASGIRVGPLVGRDSGLGQVMLRAGDRVVQLLVGRDQFASDEPAQYESVNCTGDPFIAVPTSPNPPIVEVATIGPLLEILASTGDPQTRLIGSELHTLASLGCVTLGPPESRSVQATVVLPTPYTPPFRVRSGP